jgi:hypothetical protein
LDKAELVELNRTIDSSFGGISQIISSDAHYYYINTTHLSEQLAAAGRPTENEDIYLELVQEEHDSIFIRLFMDKLSFPTERRYQFKADTLKKNKVHVRLPSIARGLISSTFCSNVCKVPLTAISYRNPMVYHS